MLKLRTSCKWYNFINSTTISGGITTANQPAITSLGNLDTVGATDGTLAVRGNLNVGTSGQGKTVRFYSKNSNSVGMVWDAASGTSDQHGSLTLGADDNGVDFTAFGDSSGKYVKWDSSANSLSTTGNLVVSGGGVIEGTISTSTQNNITTASGLTTVGTLNSGAISSGFGNIDVGTSQIATSGLLRVLVDADSDNASGSSNGGRLTLGTGQDLNLYHGGSNSYIVNKTGDLVVTTGSTGNSIILDASNSIPLVVNVAIVLPPPLMVVVLSLESRVITKPLSSVAITRLPVLFTMYELAPP